MGDRDRFERAIDEATQAGDSGRIAQARQVYADWLEERNTDGDARAAAAQRWMAATGKRPHGYRTARGGGPGWDWWRDLGGSQYCDLPPRLFAALRRGRAGPSSAWRGYADRPPAEQALADALADLAAERLTRLSDLALLCSNCHRMVHRRRPWLRLGQLTSLLTTHRPG
jgi:hypothetical protein